MEKTLIERVDLYFTEGSADKVYRAQLFEVAGGSTVEFQYGRRGSTLKPGTKTASPVDAATAKAIFDKLVKEKTAKGYTPDISGEIFTGGDKAQAFTGVLPQLLNAISEADSDEIVANANPAKWGNFGQQEKFDGERRELQRVGAMVRGINRKGMEVGIPQVLADALADSGTDLLLDGEIMGTRYVAFDLLEYDGEDLRSLPYKARLAKLESLELPAPIEVAATVRHSDGKDAMRNAREAIRARRGEGVIYKDMLAPWSADRPDSGGPALKFKFYATATVCVTGVNAGKRSVGIAVYDTDGNLVSVGNVTVPPNQDIPAKGDLIEVRYLYAYPGGGSLFQPTMLGRRTDLDPAAAAMSQLKYKAGATDAIDEDDQ